MILVSRFGNHESEQGIKGAVTVRNDHALWEWKLE
jgi:hypothetical protein